MDQTLEMFFKAIFASAIFTTDLKKLFETLCRIFCNGIFPVCNGINLEMNCQRTLDISGQNILNNKLIGTEEEN